MYFAQSPAVVSRRIFPAPVKAPKYTVPVSTATGAARTIVGVPTFPRKASTALGPRAIAVVEIGVVLPWPSGSGVVDEGHFAGVVSETCTSVNARAAISAVGGS